jgi:MoaA/NifB/PqqE/SkfB family radical SAM enzyme
MNYPTRVQIGVSYRCNVRCLVCDQRAEPDGPVMEWELFERALPLISAGCTVALFGRGEPLLHPRFVDMVRAVAERGGVPVTTTNGTMLSAALSRELYDAGLRSVTVSIYGADAELHERLQPGVDSEKVWRNVADCLAAGIHVSIATTLIPDTLAELVPIARRAYNLGVRCVSWSRLQGCPRVADPLLGADGWTAVDAAKAELETLSGMMVNDCLGPR